VAQWAAAHWYQEINQLLENKTVLHVNCFDSNQAQRLLLKGTVLPTNLVDISTVDHGGAQGRLRSESLLEQMNLSHNHLTVQGNQGLAQQLIEIVQNPQISDLDIQQFIRA
jgi:hypothetical protein